MLLPLAGGSSTVVKFGEFIMILELYRQGLKVAAIARQLGVDRKTVRKYISRGLEPPAYGPRPRRQKSTDPLPAVSARTACRLSWPHRGAAVARNERARLCWRLHRGEARRARHQA